MAERLPDSHFRVIIVGGSIAGLTLAISCARKNIDFILLEARAEVAPQLGAAVAIMSHGAMILDQLGVFEDILQFLVPLSYIYTWRDDGKLLSKLDTPNILHTRHGYPIGWVERRLLLQTLFKHLPAKSKVLLNKKCINAHNTNEGIVAFCSDGTTFRGRIIVGADGVHSSVRTNMWTHMQACGMEAVLKKDHKAMVAQYSCVYGISKYSNSLEEGTAHRTYGKGFSFILAVAKEGHVHWFLITRMKQLYSKPNIPRYNRDDLDAHIKLYLGLRVAGAIRFESIYRNAISCHYTPLEEATYDYWAWNQFVCVGDSVHKMTPNLGLGANTAIENAASLTNCIASMLEYKTASQLLAADIHCQLLAWAASRKRRTDMICLISNMFTRLEALATWRHGVIALHAGPHLANFAARLASSFILGCERLDFLPFPERSLKASTPFQDQKNEAIGYQSSKLRSLTVYLLRTYLV